MTNDNKLIGKLVYLQKPEMVSSTTDVYVRPVVVESLVHSDNSAAVIINGKHIVPYSWYYTLLDIALNPELNK